MFDGRVEMERVGKKIDRFELLQRLGRGGFGEVYLALDPDRDERVAIKIMHPSLSVDSRVRSRFLTEGRALEKLSHPNIVRCYGTGQLEDDLFIVTEFLEGESLRDCLRQKEFAADDAVRLIIDVGQALAEAHAHGILHRDVKPENIMIHPSRGAVLLDFGLARLMEEDTITRPGQMMGTWKYMSPEMLRSEEVDRRTDIFSLGIVLYEVLTGKRPFGGQYDAAVIYSILHDEPAPLSSDGDPSLKSLRRILARALRKEPNHRYQHAVDLVTDLERLLAGEQPVEFKTEDTSPGIPQIVSLAVLALRNLCPPESEYVAYGITDELIQGLSRIPRIRLASMKAVQALKDPSSDLSGVAEQLNVRYVLEGSLDSEGPTLLLTANLHDTAANCVLWSTTWEGEQSSLLELNRVLLTGIFSAFGIPETESVAATTKPSVRMPDPVAYEYYLRGKYLFEHKTTAADVSVAASLFDQALQRETQLVAASIGLASVHIHQGEYRDAIRELEVALKHSRFAGQKSLEIEIELALADAYYHLADWNASELHAETAKELSRRAGDMAFEAKARTILIDILEPQAKYEAAMSHYRRIVKINQQLQRKDKLATAIKSIAVIYHRRGKFDLALHHYNEALELCRLQRQVDIEAKLLNNIGLVHHQLDNKKEAQHCFEKALSLHRQLGEFGSTAVNLNNLGVIRFVVGDYPDAMKRFVDAAKAAGDVGDRKNYALALENQGKTQVMLGNYDKATSLNQKARDLASELNFQLVILMAERNLGDIETYQGHYPEAEKHYKLAQVAAESGELRNEECILLISRMRMAERACKYQTCRELAERALVILQELHLKKHLAIVASYRAYSRYLIEGDDRQIQRLRFYYDTYGDRVDPPQQIAIRRLLAQAISKYGNPDQLDKDVRLMLETALKLSQKHKIRYEKMWLHKLLEKPGQP